MKVQERVLDFPDGLLMEAKFVGRTKVILYKYLKNQRVVRAPAQDLL